MAEKFTAQSGAEITINMAGWKEAKTLKKVLQAEISKLDLTGIDKATDINALLPLVMQIDSSDALDAALWPCLVRCLRGTEKITEQTFENVDARADYYEIMLKCISVNMRPFVVSLFSLLPPVIAAMAKDLWNSVSQKAE